MAEAELTGRIKEIVDSITAGRGSPEGPRAELQARVAVLVASEVERATDSVTINLIELTSRVGQLSKAIENLEATLSGTIEKAATALNETTNAGNKLNKRIGVLTFAAVLLAVVQVCIAIKGH